MDAHYHLCKHGQKALNEHGFKGQQGENEWDSELEVTG